MKAFHLACVDEIGKSPLLSPIDKGSRPVLFIECRGGNTRAIRTECVMSAAISPLQTVDLIEVLDRCALGKSLLKDE
ncbi:hypothetical protein D3C81_1735330 [compost metagenome]